MSEISFRAATLDDVDEIVALWVAADAPPTITDGPDDVRRLLARDDQALILAMKDDVMVGTLIAGWDGWRGNMYRLAVHPDHRRDGVATQLVAEGLRRLEELGCRRVSALVLREEDHAMGFWKTSFSEQPDIARFSRNVD